MRGIILLTAVFAALGVPDSHCAEATTNASRTNSGAATDRSTNRPGRFSRQIVLGPDDKPAFAAAPAGFDRKREGIARGEVKTVTYPSSTVGTNRQMIIYTPPGYAKNSDTGEARASNERVRALADADEPVFVAARKP